MWTLPKPLTEATFLKREKRFFCHARLTGSDEPVVAHCANTGSMKSCMQPGSTIYLLHNPSPTRKLAYSWEYTKTAGGLIGINTARPNLIAQWAISSGLIPELKVYDTQKGEVKYGKENSRIDILLTDSKGKRPDCYVEVKNTTLLDQDVIRFPDAVTDRGRKHLNELMHMVRQGHRAVMLFFVNRPEGTYFAPADSIDPEYADTLRAAADAGVELLAYRPKTTLSGIKTMEAVPIELGAARLVKKKK